MTNSETALVILLGAALLLILFLGQMWTNALSLANEFRHRAREAESRCETLRQEIDGWMDLSRRQSETNVDLVKHLDELSAEVVRLRANQRERSFFLE